MEMMRFNRILQMAATVILVLGPLAGHAQNQTYQYSGPINGYTEVALTPEGLGFGGFNADFGTVTESLIYNPVAQTLQEIGSVTVNPSSKSINITGSFFTPGESGSATLTVGNGGSFSFDTTFNSVGVTGVDPVANLFVPVSGAGTYNGQAFAGSWDLDIPLELTSFSDSPTSLAFTESSINGAANGGGVVPGTDLVDGSSDGTYYYSWSQDPVVTEASTPDATGTFQLFAGVLIALGACKYFLGRQAPLRR
jgi:hypothetical protein